MTTYLTGQLYVRIRGNKEQVRCNNILRKTERK